MQINIVNFKAFGDFVIACGAIKRINSNSALELPKIIAGEHVRNLAAALKLEQNIHFIGDSSWKDVPAAFDVRKRGLYAAFKSLLEIRRLLRGSSAEINLIFDKLGWREKLIGYGFQVHQLSDIFGNIYIAYDNFMAALGFDLDNEVFRGGYINKAIIIPGARMSHRVIPAHVIASYVGELALRNIHADVIVLEGEVFDLPRNINLISIPRKFDILIEKIKNTDLVISADSLPSHLSEYLHVPIFVSTPAPKPYWLPRSSYETAGWATFQDIRSLQRWLEDNFYF